MKKFKVIGVIIGIMLILPMLVGCSTNKTTISQKTEEELKAEIRAEMEAEAKMKEELEREIRAKLEAERKEKEEAASIVLSFPMTKSEIIEKIGDGYTFKTEEEGGYFQYISYLIYDGIEYYFYHDEKEFPSKLKSSGVTVTSNKYRFNYDFKIGDTPAKAFEYCENNFENAYDRHGDQYVFDMFMYKEKTSSGDLVDTGYILRWNYDTEIDYYSKDEISQDAKIKSISIFELLD